MPAVASARRSHVGCTRPARRSCSPRAAGAEPLGERSLALACDVTVEADRERLVAATHGAFGRIDGLVNNAAISRVAPALREPLEDFREALETNLVAPFALSVLACREMRSTGGGAIVNVSSSLALRSIDRTPHAGYVASKSGLVGLTRELASQWGRYNVRVNAVAPGFFPTEMNRDIQAGDGDVDPWLRERIPCRAAAGWTSSRPPWRSCSRRATSTARSSPWMED